jgi:amidophosphoribosyltransferase
MGVDMARGSDFIAHKLDNEGICRKIGADSLGYLSRDGMLAAIRETVMIENSYCDACFTGNYPIVIPEWLLSDDRDKHLFDNIWGD